MIPRGALPDGSDFILLGFLVGLSDLDLRAQDFIDLRHEVLSDEPPIGLALDSLLLAEGPLSESFLSLEVLFTLNDLMDSRLLHILTKLLGDLANPSVLQEGPLPALTLPLFPPLEVVELVQSQVRQAHRLSKVLCPCLKS